ncbi:MAG: helix-turn-helix transcriptional regulator [Anaerolineae bacterium]
MRIQEIMALRSKIIGVLLKNVRTRAGRSQKDCARVLGCSPRTISDYEYGRRDISLPELEVLARFLQVPISHFWQEGPEAREEEEKSGSEEVMAIRRKIIGVLLRQARLTAKKTQKDCAEVLGCSVDRASQYERGQRDVPLPALEVLADFLGVPITHFLDEELVCAAGATKWRTSS